ncbi:erythromycin esterase family protein [Pontibacter akesuensis]|uniref:Erythromycin esterase homolog n=1 Tax=Pontibacter akesuensis TaxID=388950 RepID=A0A1I7GLJ3_9BACT|nr:erythromycin esterase family protein [Pontibacter akesuensis]GHA56144.1 hypothetical protein GCM10007389_04630 [Pontibacter akesuensis]SFU49318.1 Erythromycin esterase homolog [Pontibacter akesuensis]
MKKIHLFPLLFTLVFFSCSVGESDKDVEDVAAIPAEAMHALESDADLDVLLHEIGDARLVLLGEASHGTSEFYTWRARISRRLVEEKGFKIIAVEGDWMDTYPLNNYIRGNSNYTSAEAALKEFDRWPTWMWANKEIAELAEWLRAYNQGKAANAQVGFYGLDVYGMWESLEAVQAYLQQTDPAAAESARQVLNCFSPYSQDEIAYARATLTSSDNCADELAKLLEDVQQRVAAEGAKQEAAFNALQNTMVVVNAENYYRTAVRSDAASWNIRDRHMTGTIERLLAHHDPDAKIIVWEHNTHVGDARATTMVEEGTVNVGQLVREQYGPENVCIVGFGTYTGTVLAAPSWGSPVQVMKVPQAKRNSWEWILHNQEPPNKLIFLDALGQNSFFQRRIGHRAIGVVYNPNAESGNYVPSVLPDRYNAFVFIDRTKALQPLP